MAELRALIVVLGDQLDLEAAAFDGFDAGVDAVWMAEVADESTHVWSSKPRTAMFLAAMRHFAPRRSGTSNGIADDAASERPCSAACGSGAAAAFRRTGNGLPSTSIVEFLYESLRLT